MIKLSIKKYIAIFIMPAFFAGQIAYQQGAFSEPQQRMPSEVQIAAVAFNSDLATVKVAHSFAFLAAIPAIIAGVVAAAKAAAATASAVAGAVVGAVKGAAAALAVKVPLIAKGATLVGKIAPTVKKLANGVRQVVNIAERIHKGVERAKEHVKASPAAAAALRAMRSGVTFAAAVQLTSADAAAVQELQQDQTEINSGVVELKNAGEKVQAEEEYALYQAAVKCSGFDPIKNEQVNAKPTDDDCQDFDQSSAAESLAKEMPAIRFALAQEGEGEQQGHAVDILDEAKLEQLEKDTSNLERDGNATAAAEENLAAALEKMGHDKEAGASQEQLDEDIKKILEDTNTVSDADAGEFADFEKTLHDNNMKLDTEEGGAHVEETSLKL
jgi:hypothetical protein